MDFSDGCYPSSLSSTISRRSLARPILVFHTWLTVPIVTQALYQLFNWMIDHLGEPFTKWIFLLEQSKDSLSVVFDCYDFPIDVKMLPQKNYDNYVVSWVEYYVKNIPSPGTILLVAKNGDFSSLRSLQQVGWKIIVVHPPGVGIELLTLTEELWELPLQIGSRLPCIGNPAPFLSPTPMTFDALPTFLATFSTTRCFPIDNFQDFLIKIIPTQLAEMSLESITQEIIFLEFRHQIMNFPIPASSFHTAIKKMKKENEVEEMKMKELILKEKSEIIVKIEIKEEIKQPPSPPVEVEMPRKTLAELCKAVKNQQTKVKKETLPRETAMLTMTKEQKKRNSIKFAPQCPIVLPDKQHHEPWKCGYWHPKKACDYYPNCYLGAVECGYGHPFCTEEGSCRCLGAYKNVQKNHRPPSVHIHHFSASRNHKIAFE